MIKNIPVKDLEPKVKIKAPKITENSLMKLQYKLSIQDLKEALESNNPDGHYNNKTRYFTYWERTCL